MRDELSWTGNKGGRAGRSIEEGLCGQNIYFSYSICLACYVCRSSCSMEAHFMLAPTCSNEYDDTVAYLASILDGKAPAQSGRSFGSRKCLWRACSGWLSFQCSTTGEPTCTWTMPWMQLITLYILCVHTVGNEHRTVNACTMVIVTFLTVTVYDWDVGMDNAQ